MRTTLNQKKMNLKKYMPGTVVFGESASFFYGYKIQLDMRWPWVDEYGDSGETSAVIPEKIKLNTKKQ